MIYGFVILAGGILVGFMWGFSTKFDRKNTEKRIDLYRKNALFFQRKVYDIQEKIKSRDRNSLTKHKKEFHEES